MTDRRDEEPPLSSEELEQDRLRSDADPVIGGKDAQAHSLPASEGDLAGDEEGESRRPNPIAGTMLPPD